MSNQLDREKEMNENSNRSYICPYYGRTCDCNEDEQEVCDLFPHYKSVMRELLDTRAIKPEKYEELREEDFDTWLTTILHEIIEQVNFDAKEVDFLGNAVWNGECPDGSPYPMQCAREDAYIQCIRQSNQLDALRAKVDDLENQINDISIRFEEFKKYVGYMLTDPFRHTSSDFCGNCLHYQAATFPTCELSGEIIDPDDASCTMFESPLDLKELNGKPDREECKHCPKSQCDNCMNFPF